MDREIGEQDREALLSMFRIKDGIVPAAVAEVYWTFKHFKDVLDAGPLGPIELAVIGFMAGQRPIAPDAKPTTAFELLKAGNYPQGHPITVKWRKKSVEAAFYDLTLQGDVRAMLPQEMEPRNFAPEDVLAVQGA